MSNEADCRTAPATQGLLISWIPKINGAEPDLIAFFIQEFIFNFFSQRFWQLAGWIFTSKFDPPNKKWKLNNIQT